MNEPKSDDPIDDDNEDQHQKLLQHFSRGNKRNDVRRELGAAKDDASNATTSNHHLSLNKLISSAENSKKKSKTLSWIRKIDSKTLKGDPSSVISQAAERSVDFEQLAKKITEWEPLIKSNRQADKLSFPLDKEPLSYHATSQDIVKRSKVGTQSTLEEQIYASLKAASKNIPSKETGLTEKETDVLEKLDYDEVLERLKELRRHRILTANQAARFKREKSIKSKKFKRLKTRYKMEKLQNELDSKSLSAILRDRRITERSTLRHRVTGKWDRKLAHYAKHDEKSRNDLEEKRKLNKKLTAKMDNEDMESDEDTEIESDCENTCNAESEWKVVKSRKRPINIISKNGDRSNSEDGTGESSEGEMDTTNDIDAQFMKVFSDKGESVLETGAPIKKHYKRTAGIHSQIHVDPTQYLSTSKVTKSVSNEVEDEFLVTSIGNEFIQEAFEDDEDLMEEIADHAPGSKEIDENKQDFGWGHWAGPGKTGKIETKEPVSSKNNRENSKRGNFTQTKDDLDMESNPKETKPPVAGYVVINEVKNKKLAEHQLSQKDIPFAFKKPDAFESSLRQAIGPDFNTAASFRSFVQPRVQKKVGVPIDPISKNVEPSNLTM